MTKFNNTSLTNCYQFLGEISVWDDAEKALEEALDDWAGKGKWNLKKGDGAFYGPKIDIQIFDVYKYDNDKRMKE